MLYITLILYSVFAGDPSHHIQSMDLHIEIFPNPEELVRCLLDFHLQSPFLDRATWTRCDNRAADSSAAK